MKRWQSCLFVVFIIMFNGGCDPEDKPGASGLHDFRFLYKNSDEGCTNCNQRYYFSFSDNKSGTHYYWIAIKQWDNMKGHGTGIKLTAPFNDAIHYIDVSYSFKLENSGTYEFYAYACNDSIFVGEDRGQIGTSGPIDTNVLFVYDEFTCRSTCCTIGRRYATVYRDIWGVSGASAQIWPKFGKLCGQDHGATDVASSVVHVGVNYETADYRVVWAQMGIGISRNHSSGAQWYMPFIYAEINYLSGITEFLYTQEGVSVDTCYNYSIILDMAKGQWTFEKNGGFFDTSSRSSDWQTYGTRVYWTGEILNFEDDMVGNQSEMCLLKQCSYYETTWNNPDFTSLSNPPGIRRSDDNEWWIIWFDENTLHIWDKNPLL